MINYWRRDCAFFAVLAAVGAGFALFLSLANGWLGPLNQDEGWYLLAARHVYGGGVPYRDFAFTQGPVMPVVYAPLTPLINSWGLASARAATIVLGWLTALTGAALAGRLVEHPYRRPAACMAWVLISVNVYHSYFTTIVKTYALAGLFLTAGFYFLCLHRDRPSRGALVAAAMAFVLAAGTRISLVVVGPIMFLALWQLRKEWPRAWCWFGLSGVLAGLLVFGTFAVIALDGFWFGMVEYHTGRSPGNLVEALALKAGFVSRVFQGYYVAALLCLVLLVLRICYGRLSAAVTVAGPVPALLRRAAGAALAVVTLIHFASPFPYDDYQVVIYAPLCALLVAAFVRFQADSSSDPMRRLRPAALILLGAAVMASISSPINQEWFVSGRDRIWWNFKPRSDLRTLQIAAERVKEIYDRSNGKLLTHDAYLAVETGLRIPDALTLGPFSYFPDMPTERARLLHVTNREILVDLLRRGDASVAAFSGYGLAIAAPAIVELPEEEQALLWQALLERYELHDEISGFGQAHTTLRILRRRDDAEEARDDTESEE